jgi:hypothetical protein
MSCLSDVMFVIGVPFVVSVARGLNLVAAKNTLFRLAKNLAAGIKGVMALYSRGVFRVGTILMDNKFEGVALVQTVHGNTDGFIKHEVKDACAACKAQVILGHPTDCKFLGMVCINMITSCPMTPTAVENDHTIFVPDLAVVRGKTVMMPPDAVTTEYVQIPQAIQDCFQLVTLTADVMFV